MMASGGYYSDRSIERVRSSTDIVSVIGRYVSLKKAGRSIKGLCPFHKEKTPSFFVSPDRQMYHCFGCGAGGDVFSFLMNYLNFSFSEAVEELAAEAAIELERTGVDSTRTDVFREILAESQSYYRARFRGSEGKRARLYLQSRNLSEQTVERLGVGWAPEKGDLTVHLRERGYSESQLVEAGVSLISTRGGGAYDRFRGRVLFPISDRRGRVISFGGRLLDDKDGKAPKYLNGPDSPIYSKGDYLYGYREAAPSARDLDMVILVEGYFDHARFVEKGFDCTVATCGTALTAAQARQIGGLASSVFICYDGDSAGNRASVRAAEVLLQQGFLPRIMCIPDGQDPDDYLDGRPDEAVLKLASEALDPIRFALGLLDGWSSVRGTQRQVKVVQRLAGIASSATEPVIRETLLRIISQETGYSMETLELELREKEKSGGRKSGVGARTRETGSRRPDGDSGQGGRSEGSELSGWDTRLLAGMLLSPMGLTDPLIQFLEPDDFRSRHASEILSEIKRQTSSGLSAFQLSGLQEPQRSICARILSVHPERTAPEDQERLITAVEKARLQKERRELREMQRSGDAGEDVRRRIAEIEDRIKSM